MVLICNKTMNTIASLHFFVKWFLYFQHFATEYRTFFMEYNQSNFSHIYTHSPTADTVPKADTRTHKTAYRLEFRKRHRLSGNCGLPMACTLVPRDSCVLSVLSR